MTEQGFIQTNEFYTPGVCNINELEAAYRRKKGFVFVIISLVVLILLIIFTAPPVFGLSIFAPSFVAALGFLQARSNFCVSYASSGIFNASRQDFTTQKVLKKADKKRDAQKTRKIVLMSLAASLCVALLCALLLSFIQ